MQAAHQQAPLAVKKPDQFLLTRSGEIRNEKKDYMVWEYTTR